MRLSDFERRLNIEEWRVENSMILVIWRLEEDPVYMYVKASNSEPRSKLVPNATTS